MLEYTNPDAESCTGMYRVQNVHIYEESKEIQEGSPTNNFFVGKYGLSSAERWQDMPSMSFEVDDT